MHKIIATYIAVLFLVSCVKVDKFTLPNYWEKPEYTPVEFGDCNDTGCFMSHKDLGSMLKNQAQCEVIRKGLVDIVKALQ